MSLDDPDHNPANPADPAHPAHEPHWTDNAPQAPADLQPVGAEAYGYHPVPEPVPDLHTLIRYGEMAVIVTLPHAGRQMATTFTLGDDLPLGATPGVPLPAGVRAVMQALMASALDELEGMTPAE